MSSDLERRLERMLDEVPDPAPGAGEAALARALSSLRPTASPHRGLRTAVLVFAAAVVLLAIAAGSLAGAGALHVSFGAKTRTRASALALPPRAAGIATVVDGRLSVVTQSGFRLQGLAVSAATLSPQALYVAAGIADSLVVMAPNGHRAWSRPAGGKVVSIAWAPDGLQIAYIVRNEHGLALHLIYGNGKKDTTIDRSVRRVLPSWRADSLALAYVGGGGKAIVYDIGHSQHAVVSGSPTDVSQVAFAPSGSQLAVLAGNRVVVGKKRLSTQRPLAGIGWLGSGFAMLDRHGQLGPVRVHGPILAFQSNGEALAVVRGGSDTRVLAGPLGHLGTVLRLPAGTRVETVVVR